MRELLAAADANPRSAAGEQALLDTVTTLRERGRCRELRVQVVHRFAEEYPGSPRGPPMLLELVRDLHDAGEREQAVREAERVVSWVPDSGDAFSAIRWVAVLKKELGDVAGAARALGEFVNRRLARSEFAVPRPLLETLAELQREAGFRREALQSAKWLLELDRSNAVAVSLQLEQAMTDPRAPLEPMLDQLVIVKREPHNPEMVLARTTRLVLDHFLHQVERSPPSDAQSTAKVLRLFHHEGLEVVGHDAEAVGQLWRRATILTLVANAAATSKDPALRSSSAGLREQAELMFGVCLTRAKDWGVPSAACRSR